MDENPYAAPQAHGPLPGEPSKKQTHSALKESGRVWLIGMTLGGAFVGQWLFGADAPRGIESALRIVGFIFGSFAGACTFLMLWYSRQRPDEAEAETANLGRPDDFHE